MGPLDDPDYVAGSKAQDEDDFEKARRHFERASDRGNFFALGELCIVCDRLGDLDATRRHTAKLEALALMSAEASYVAAKSLESCFNTFAFDECKTKHNRYLLNAADIGNPMAQLEVASNLSLGANGFEKSRVDAQRWVRRAADQLGNDGLPDWAREMLTSDA